MTCLAVPVLLLLSALPTMPEDEVRGLAREIEAASPERLREIAAAVDRDPWETADAFCRLKLWTAALRLAGAAEGPDTKALPAYIGARRNSPVPAAVYEALEAVQSPVDPNVVLEAVPRLLAARKGADDFLRALMDLVRGEVLARSGDRTAAAAAYRDAAVAARGAGWLRGACEALERRSWLLPREEALAVIREWVTITSGREDEIDLAIARLHLGNTYGDLGDLSDAREEFRLARRAVPPEAKGLLLHVLGSQGIVESRFGQFSAALEKFEAAIDLAKRLGDDLRRGLLILDLAETHDLLGDYVRAGEFAEQGRTLLEALPNEEGIARAEATIGLAILHLGRHVEAAEFFERAVARYEAIEKPVMTAIARSNLALALAHTERRGEAQALQVSALEPIRASREPWREAHVQLNLAQICRLTGKDGEAEKHEAAALILARELQAADLLVEAHLCAARRHLERERYVEAVTSARLAAKYVGVVVHGLATEQSALARSHHEDVFQVGIAAAAGAGDLAAVTAMLEAGRAGVLLETVRNREAILHARLTPELRMEHKRAKQAVVAASSRLRLARRRGDSKEVRRLARALKTARESNRAISQEIGRARRVGATGADPEPRSLDEIRGALRRGDALVYYSLPEDGNAIALVVSPKKQWKVELATTESIVLLVDSQRIVSPVRGRGLDVTSSRPSPRVDLELLSRSLIEPLGLDDTVRRLLVSPDGVLFRVPWTAIVGDREAACVSSGTTLSLLRAKEPDVGRGVLAVGNPEIDWTSTLRSLPASEREVDTVGDRKLKRKEATETAFLQRLGGGRLWRSVHFAGHAVVHPDKPLGAALLLAADKVNDGRLTALEVYGLDVRTELVVLSACDTASGKLYRSEGLTGLTHAFICAGSPRVISSLWKVDDAATSALMEKFYEQWLGGKKRTSAALRAAQEHVRSFPKWRHPAYWAAWQLWGLPD